MLPRATLTIVKDGGASSKKRRLPQTTSTEIPSRSPATPAVSARVAGSGPYFSPTTDHSFSYTSFATCQEDSTPSSSSRSGRTPPPTPNSPRQATFLPSSTFLPASTFLPLLFVMPPRPSPTEDPSPLHRHNSTEARAIGPKAGAIFLASNGVKRAQEEANDLGERFSINGALRARGVESKGTSESDPIPPAPPSLRRLPGADDGAAGGKEGSIRELTKRASLEEDRIRGDEQGTAARTRRDSISRGTAAGLGTPWVGRKEKVEEKQYPPTSAVRPVRKRATSDASSGSTGSTSKDYLLSQLAEALKKERRRCQLYEQEILVAEEEVRSYFRRLLRRTKTDSALRTD